MRFASFILFIAPFICVGQIDTVQNVIETVVSDHNTIFRKTNSSLSKKDIEELNASDVGELIQKIAGANLKSYGSLGGLKTVSMRGLGSNHSTVVKDGFSINNSQTGQINLGKIQVDNVVGLVSTTGERLRFIIPVSAQVSGSNFMIKSFENIFSSDTLSIRASSKIGSFGQNIGYGALKFQPGKLLLSMYGSMRKSDGDYKFVSENGLNTNESIRFNNDYGDYSFGGVLGRRMNNGYVRAGYRNLNINQGLPGAVILYNNTADERMETQKHTVFADYIFNTKFSDYRIYANGEISDLRYIDSTFLNNSGGIDVTYNNQTFTCGFTFNGISIKDLVLSGGVEEKISKLVSTDTSFAQPIRFHNFGLLSLSYTGFKFKYQLEASSQYVTERNFNGPDGGNQFRINPFVSARYRKKSEAKITHNLWYRNSFRMPSFNELYYNNVGNNELEPEDAHQINYGFEFFPTLKGKDVKIKVDVYYNHVKNKILAIPTKNLFVWSMQNIGRSKMFGGDFIISVKQKLSKDFFLRLTANYSYQRAVDVSDTTSPTYGHQIAYIPEHSGNFDISLYYKTTGIRISNYMTSLRYSLNENISQNEVEPFTLTDFSIFHTLKIKKKNSVKIQFNIKNVFNSSYSYIRSFVMPGRNYLISLSYAFN